MNFLLGSVLGAVIALPLMGAAQTISGSVADVHGSPVLGATVQAIDLTRPMAMVVPNTTSNASGYWVISGLQPGNYTIFAKKESDFYPQQLGDFFLVHPSPVVVLKVRQHVSGVAIHLSPRGGQIIGDVYDGETGKRIPADELLWRDQRRLANYSTNRFDIIAPPVLVELRITAEAPGYSACQLGPIAVRAGKITKFTIFLHKLPAPAPKSRCWQFVVKDPPPR